MAYKKEYLSEMTDINELFANDKENEAQTIKKVEDYFKSIKSLGCFSVKDWNEEWRKQIYYFGEKFKKKSPDKIFQLLNAEIESSKEKNQIEVLEFIKTEIYINFFPVEESIRYLKQVSEQFPLNPDFKHTLFILYQQKNERELACKYLRQAIKIDKENKAWLESIFRIEYDYSESLIEQKNHDKAGQFINDIIQSRFYLDYRTQEYQNFFIFLKQRNKDQLLIENKLTAIRESSKKQVDDLFEKSRVRIIEILGFFTAVIAFIFGTVTISLKMELASALILTSSLGMMLLIFSLSLSILFVKSEKRIIKDIRFWLLIILVLINLGLIFKLVYQ